MNKKTVYERILGDGGFSGADFSSAPTHADPRRLTECVNMWRDYSSDVGDYVETFPGVRRIAALGGEVHGLFSFQPAHDPLGRAYLIVHVGRDLYAVPAAAGADAQTPALIASSVMAERESVGVRTGEALALLDGTHFYLVTFVPATGVFACEDTRDRYVPLTYDNDEPYAQRNALSSFFEERWTLSDPARRRGRTPGLRFEVTDPVARTCRVSGIDAPHAMVHLPSSAVIDGEIYRVTEVKPYAFQNDPRLEVLTMDEGITKLAPYAFNTCLMLREVYLCETLTEIGKACFAYCERLNVLHLPASLTDVGRYAFYMATALTTVCYAADADAWSAVTVGEYNDSLPAPACGTSAFPEAQTIRLSLHERCGALSFVTLDGQTLGDSAFFETEDEVAAAGKTYYALVADRYDPLTVAAGDALPAGACEPTPVWYEYDAEGGVVTSVVIFARRLEDVKERTLLCRGRLADGERTPSERPACDAVPSLLAAPAHARVGVMFDGRLFLSGAPEAPGVVFYSERGPDGRNRPDYIGVCNYMEDGNAATANVAMSATSERLLVYKGAVGDGASVCCHTPADTGSSIVPRIYPAETGTMGPGCVGCAVNFSDDAVFVSPRGLEATIPSRITAERSLYHRSTPVDARLCAEDLSAVRAAEWDGYLLLLVPGGRVYMADSRRTFSSPTGERSYEWFLLEGIGAWQDDAACFAYASAWPEGVCGMRSGDEEIRLAPDPDVLPFGSVEGYLAACPTRVVEGPVTRLLDGGETEAGTAVTAYTDEGLFLLCQTSERVGGRFSPATRLAAAGDLLFFATADGDLLAANTDKRQTVAQSDGSVRRAVPREDCHICRHRFLSGAVTAADCAGEPHLTKHTDKRGTVIRTKSIPGGRFELRVRTDRDDWHTVGSVTEDDPGFEALDMSNASFGTRRYGQVCFREKTKRWTYKQYALFSDAYARPFGFGAVSYRFFVAGHIKH